MTRPRAWLPLLWQMPDRRVYRVSFLIGEEATWDHRFHDLDGREVDGQELRLSPEHKRQLQARCDRSVGDAARWTRSLQLELPR